MGEPIGEGLTAEAAEAMGLPVGLPVAQGGADAFVGMLGLGVVQPGQLGLITGSSHLHLCLSKNSANAPGVWGAYKCAPLPDLNMAEGGQSSTGSTLRWLRGLLGGDRAPSYAELDAEAAKIAPGAEGLMAVETFQGSRTPITDPLARGAMLGLTMRHSRAHVWRAFLEATCLGTRAAIEAMVSAGHSAKEITVCGGACQSDTWLQLHADVTGLPVIIGECPDGPLLGCACLAASAAGMFESPAAASTAFFRRARRIEPDPEAVRAYDQVFAAYQTCGGCWVLGIG
mmetsp:Transcript_34171/g.89976  ORF Transcript_34171/g.89976 Transcript_34171/m.89976 type:complete len:286 (-) Transcript_34171:889-1746(-)